MVNLPASLLVGPWVGTYGPFTLLTEAISPPAKTNPVPNLGGHFTASGALFTLNFDGNGGHTGKIRVNFAGTVPILRPFTGTYALFTDPTLGIVEGTILLQFSTTDVSKLEFMMRSQEELVFLLVESQKPTGITAGGAVSHGTLKRTLAIDIP
jgi:hypothetical protein